MQHLDQAYTPMVTGKVSLVNTLSPLQSVVASVPGIHGLSESEVESFDLLHHKLCKP